jgi:hypothetical protein
MEKGAPTRWLAVWPRAPPSGARSSRRSSGSRRLECTTRLPPRMRRPPAAGGCGAHHRGMRRPPRGSCAGGRAPSLRGWRTKVGGDGAPPGARASLPSPPHPSICAGLLAGASSPSLHPRSTRASTTGRRAPTSSTPSSAVGAGGSSGGECCRPALPAQPSSMDAAPLELGLAAWGWRCAGSCAPPFRPRARAPWSRSPAHPPTPPRRAGCGRKRSRAPKEQRRDVGERNEEGR